MGLLETWVRLRDYEKEMRGVEASCPSPPLRSYLLKAKSALPPPATVTGFD